MKIYWSAFLSLTLLLVLAGCGQEQFGTTPQSESNPLSGPETFQQTSCAGKTEIKPIVDILYVVDNSTSSFYISTDIQNAIKNTINSISNQFDYRVIGTPLIKTGDGDNDFQVLSKSASSLPPDLAGHVITSPSQFSFFSPLVLGAQERGLSRIQEFISSHQNDGLFRKGAYLFIVLVSNGRDIDVEKRDSPTEAPYATAQFAVRQQEFAVLKNYLESQQFRLFSLTADNECVINGERTTSSARSYGDMSKVLYQTHTPPLPYQSARPDHYDLCGSSISSVFAKVNAEIKQDIIPHSYQYAVATNTSANIDTQPGRIQVLKVSNGVATPMTSGWSYYENTAPPIETRVNKDTGATIPGEPTNARHLVKFASGNYITYPDCVAVTALSNMEYFGFVVLPKIPDESSVKLKVNGVLIPKSDSNGWKYIGQQTRNIKVPFGPYSDQPPVSRTGYMLQLNGSTNYYKSGDNVTIDYVPKSSN